MSEAMFMVKFSELARIRVDPGPKFWWKCNYPNIDSTTCIHDQESNSESEATADATEHLVNAHGLKPMFWIPLEDSNAV